VVQGHCRPRARCPDSTGTKAAAATTLVGIGLYLVLVLPGLRRFSELEIPNPAAVTLLAVGCGRAARLP